MKISGRVVDVGLRAIYGAELTIAEGRIVSVVRMFEVPDRLIMPGFIDAHVHIESSMVTPGAFAFQAVRHGTVAVVADPHEIANVMGVEGVRFMMRDAESVPLKFVFGVPSCVPATPFESSGAVINAEDVRSLLLENSTGFLSEMMNFPGVIDDDSEVHAKLEAARKTGKPIDGHAPGLTGDRLRRYVSAGISTDHECTTLEEAREKISAGMKILIREGSAARNLETLHPLVESNTEMVMLCCDDIHPDDLLEGHINVIFNRLLKKGYNLFDLITIASVNPAIHYGTGTGLLREGDSADFIIVDDLVNFNILSTYIDGVEVYGSGEVNFSYKGGCPVNNFNCSDINTSDIATSVTGKKIRVLEVFDGELFTAALEVEIQMPGEDRHETSGDILKIVVKERYNDGKPAAGFVKGFRIRHGALASSVAHDSHNIIAVGADDESIVRAINKVVEMKGGLVWCGGNGEVISLPLSIAGLLSSSPVAVVAASYQQLTKAVLAAGSQLRAPFMTLSFLALLVIPELKIGDKGLFDVNRFCNVPLIIE
jgi:adenine deaminase